LFHFQLPGKIQSWYLLYWRFPLAATNPISTKKKDEISIRCHSLLHLHQPLVLICPDYILRPVRIRKETAYSDTYSKDIDQRSIFKPLKRGFFYVTIVSADVISIAFLDLGLAFTPILRTGAQTAQKKAPHFK